MHLNLLSVILILCIYLALISKVVRLHVGGLPGKITHKDVEDRFRSFGTVQEVDIIPHPFEGMNQNIIVFKIIFYLIVYFRRSLSRICIRKFGDE